MLELKVKMRYIGLRTTWLEVEESVFKMGSQFWTIVINHLLKEFGITNLSLSQIVYDLCVCVCVCVCVCGGISL